MQEYINNIYKTNSRFYISYEVGVMLGVIDNSFTNIDLVDSVKRICKNVKLNSNMVSEGFIHYCKENLVEYDVASINEIFLEYGLEELE